MKILMISTDKTLLGQAGVGDAVKRHQEYARRVARLDILVLGGNGKVNQFASNGQAIALPRWGAQQQAEKLFAQQQYNLIVCQDPFWTGSLGVVLKKKFQAKLIIHFHGDFFDNPYWLKEHRRHRWYKKMAEKNITHADSLRVVSDGIKQKLINRGIADYTIFKISTPVNLDQFKMPAGDFTTKKKIVLTVGRIVKAKDFPTLIRAAGLVYQQVPDLEWQIIGDGPLLEKFKRQTKSQPYITWLGLVDHQKLRNYYQQAMVVVMTSNNESFGKVFLEGAMAGLPAVATNTVGAQEIIDNGVSGYIVSIGDAPAVAERISYLLKTPAAAAQMGQAAYRTVTEKFGWQKNIEAIIGMWRQTVGAV
jgi:glycosyltransferase involved in cell wall biosynthesis